MSLTDSRYYKPVDTKHNVNRPETAIYKSAQSIDMPLLRRQLIAWVAAAIGCFAVLCSAMPIVASAQPSVTGGQTEAHVSQRDIDALSTAGVLYIATVRKDGNQSTSAPVWFTVSPTRLVYIQTQPTTWKAKRVRRGSPVIVWIGRKRGPAFIGTAEITRDTAVERQITEDYPKKYLMARFGFNKPTKEMFDSGKILSIVITPVRDLPDGFTSQPGTSAPRLDSAHG